MKHCSRILALVLALGAGCAKTSPIRLELNPEVAKPEKSVIIFFVDGLDHTRFHKLLAEHQLPNFQRYFVDGGVGVDYAITSIPAMTYPNTVSLFTGRFPGHHDVVGNQWFDRRTLAYPNYITVAEYSAVNNHFRWPTLYEILSDQFSVNILGNVARGATYTVDYHAAEGVGFYLGWYSRVDELTAGCLEDVGTLANKVERWPSIITMYFIGVDQIGHDAGSDSAAYAAGLRGIDRQIGRVFDALQRNGLQERTYAVLVADHSHTSTQCDRSLDLICWLRQHRGLKIHEGRVAGDDYADRLRELKRYDAVMVDGSYRRIVLHLRGKQGWFEKPTRAEIDEILYSGNPATHMKDQIGIGLICTADGPNKVRLTSHRGDAVVSRSQAEGRPQYKLDMLPRADGMPSDPLCYLTNPGLRSFVEAGWHSSREWLSATASQTYPDFVPQVIEYFDSDRAGELLIFADEGWAFSGHGRGEHGSPRSDDMRIPLYFTGPDLARGAMVPNGRIVDVLPTIVDLLGSAPVLAQYPPIDGVSLAPELRRASHADVPAVAIDP